MKLSFFVPGDPATQGSKKAFYIAKIGRAIVTEDCKKNKPWRSDVRNEAEKAMMAGEWRLTEKPVMLNLTFQLRRPKGHYGAKGLKKSAPQWPAKKPDTVKLARAVEDALKGVCWKDDAQIVIESIQKRYNDQPGVLVEIYELEELPEF
jgi:crossover junction endodeoxyribonuclease RusA